MNPMIMFYAGKLYTWEQEDARQGDVAYLILLSEKNEILQKVRGNVSAISGRQSGADIKIWC